MPFCHERFVRKTNAPTIAPSTAFAPSTFVTALDLSQLTSAFGDSALAFPTVDATSGLFTFTASAFCALVMLRVAAAASGKSFAIPGQSASSGDVTLLVRDGELQVDPLDREVLTREQIFAELRARGVYHLGQVARFYLEPNGSFALVKQPDPSPGLCVWPEGERSPVAEAEDADVSACAGCGHLLRVDDEAPCDACHETRREPVVR